MNIHKSGSGIPKNSEGLPMDNYDIVDHNDKPLGYTADFDETRKRGLWHRGIHIIIYTKDGRIVMQKRSPNLAYYPGEVEVSVGGAVDCGETPADAAVREVREELGIDISGHKPRYLGKCRYNHRLKNNISHNVIIYSFAVCLPESMLKFKPDPTETAQIFTLTRRQLERAIKIHRVKHFGRLTATYSYWNRLLEAVPKN